MIKYRISIIFVFFLCLYFTVGICLATGPETISKLENKALSGDVNAQIRLGFRALNSENPEHSNAIFWFQMAADRGHPDSCFWLGNFHKRGWGITPDETKAIRIWKRGAAYGSIKCMEELSLYHLENQDHIKAFAWLDSLLEIQPNHDLSNRKYNDEIRENLKLKIETEKNRISHILKIEKEIPILDPFPKQTKFAKIVLPTGAEYDGQLINEKPNGFGYKATEEGEKYLGDFKNGLANGFGRLYNREGILSFEGLWNEGVPLKKAPRNK